MLLWLQRRQIMGDHRCTAARFSDQLWCLRNASVSTPQLRFLDPVPGRLRIGRFQRPALNHTWATEHTTASTVWGISCRSSASINQSINQSTNQSINQGESVPGSAIIRTKQSSIRAFPGERSQESNPWESNSTVAIPGSAIPGEQSGEQPQDQQSSRRAIPLDPQPQPIWAIPVSCNHALGFWIAISIESKHRIVIPIEHLQESNPMDEFCSFES